MNPRQLYLYVALLLAVMAIGLLLSGCGYAPSVYDPPPARPGVVTWRMVAADQVPAACGHPDKRWIEGCAKGLEIITRPPERGDGDLAAILQHEVAHVEGWHHIPHPDGTP